MLGLAKIGPKPNGPKYQIVMIVKNLRSIILYLPFATVGFAI